MQAMHRLAGMVQPGKTVEDGPAQGRRQHPLAGHEAREPDGAQGDVGEAQLADHNEGLLALQAEDGVGREAGLQDLSEPGDEEPGADAPEDEPPGHDLDEPRTRALEREAHRQRRPGEGPA